MPNWRANLRVSELEISALPVTVKTGQSCTHLSTSAAAVLYELRKACLNS